MSGFTVMPMEEITAIAVSKNCTVEVALPTQLQLDLDSPEAYDRWQAFYHAKLANRFPGITIEEWESLGGNKHVVATLPEELSVPERIALQSQGGSDYGREFAALACHWDGSPHPILLFKPLPKELADAILEAEK